MHPAALIILLLLTMPVNALAQFGLIFPSDDIVSPGDNPTVELRVAQFDPQGHRLQEMVKPYRFGVQHLGEQTDLLATLRPLQEQGSAPWTTVFAVKRPGDLTFYAETAPRWEAADDQFVVHVVKLCINALGLEEGWDEPVGLAAEIVPLSRPYGLWTSNLFSGQVLIDGDPAPFVAIEIAYLGLRPDQTPAVNVPAAPYLIQKIRADGSGIFHYAMPRAGWWGFAATHEADWMIPKDGAEKPVAIITSFWVAARDMP